MIPRTFPSTYASNGQQQMVVYFLPSIAGLQRWLDYIPVKLAQGGVENSYANNGYIDVTVVARPTATQQAWKEYIPVYLDDAATDAWLVNARGYIPYGYALFGGASMIMDMTNTGALDRRVTFSRTSNATQFDSAGALVYAPHNLLTFSESFDNAAFTKTTTTVTANSIAAPNSTTTADTLAATGANSTTLHSFTAQALSYTFSVYLRRKTGTGAVEITAHSGGTWVAQTITSEWARYSVTQTLSAGASTPGIRIVTSADEIYAWGAQLNIGTLQPYNPTTVKNLLGFTQEFDNAGWTKSNATVTANATAAPDGSVTADTLEATASNGTVVGAYTAVASTPYTFSVYLKRKTGTGNIDISADGTTWVTQTVTNDWTRFSTTLSPTSGAKTPGIRIVTSGNEIYAWGAQLSDSASLDEYRYNPVAAPTSVAFYGPRFDYDPVTLAARGLLVEEQRTNSIRNNTMVGAVAGTPGTLPTNWIVASAAGLAFNVIGTGTESGVAYVDVQVVGTPTATAATLFFEALTQIAAVNAQTWSSSLWCKITAGATTNITSINNNVTFRDSGGASVQSARTAMSLTSAFTRYAQAGTATSASTAFVHSGLWFTVTVGSAIDITLRIGLPQLELGAFATSAIPTTTAAATRTADVATMVGANFSNWYNASEGTLFAEATPQASTAAGQTLIEAGDGTASNRIGLFKLITSGNASLAVLSGGATQASTNNGAWSVTGKIAGAYKLDNFASSYNGSAVATDTSGTVPVVNQLTLGRRQDGPNVLNGHLRRIAFFPRRLANSELQAVTA